MGYYIWGIHDKTHEITGTHFDQNQDVNREPLKHWLSRQLSPDIEFRFEEGEIICCIIKVPKVAGPKWRTLHLQFGECCSGIA